MKWKPINNTRKFVVVNCNMLAPFDEDKCKYCGRIGCTDRGYTLTVGDPPVTIGEAAWSRQLMDKLTEIIRTGELNDMIRVVNYNEPQCMRKQKRSNAQAVLEKMRQCGNDCQRNGDPCPFRGKYNQCQINVNLDDSLLICAPKDRDYFECEHHEKSFQSCYRRQEDGSCNELPEKFGFAGDDDVLLMFSHRFSAAPCRFSQEKVCTNPESLHFEGVCTMQGMMAPCERYSSVDADHAYTEGVCTYVRSADGKDDRKIFNSTGYAFTLSETEANTLCVACRISHSIAKATGLKCLGVRRTNSTPLMSDANPFAENAIQINYLYLTHPEDVAKYNPDLIAQAVFHTVP